MPEYDINRDQWGNPIERDRHEGSVWDTGPHTTGYRLVCGYPVLDKIPSVPERNGNRETPPKPTE